MFDSPDLREEYDGLVKEGYIKARLSAKDVHLLQKMEHAAECEIRSALSFLGCNIDRDSTPEQVKFHADMLGLRVAHVNCPDNPEMDGWLIFERIGVTNDCKPILHISHPFIEGGRIKIRRRSID